MVKRLSTVPKNNLNSVSIDKKEDITSFYDDLLNGYFSKAISVTIVFSSVDYLKDIIDSLCRVCLPELISFVFHCILVYVNNN